MKKLTEHDFLSELVYDRTEINLYLAAGTRLHGRIVAVDSKVIFLQSIGHGGGVQMINRRNIATVCPLAAKSGKQMRVINDMISDMVDRDAATGFA